MSISKTYPHPLATGFAYFNTYTLNQSTLLKWSATNEDEVTGYEVEFSVNQSDYKTLTNQPVNDNHTGLYSFNDNTNNNNTFVQYRIKQNFKNGNFNYSDIETVTKSVDQDKITISPNPVQNSLNISLQSRNNTNIIIHIINSVGNEVLREKKIITSGGNQFNINNIAGLSKGLYLLTTEIDGKIYSDKFIKN